MEQPQYLNSENEQKAKKVRELINKFHTTKYQKDIDDNWLKESSKLSSEIQEYLSLHHQNNFKTILAELNVNQEIPQENPLEFLTKIFSPNLDKIPVHHIIIFVRESFDFSKSHRFPRVYYKFLGVLFQSDNGPDFHMINLHDVSGELPMPKSFYDFLEKLGLQLKEAAKLYKLEEVKPRNEYHTIYLKTFDFPYFCNYWPGKVTILD